MASGVAGGRIDETGRKATDATRAGLVAPLKRGRGKSVLLVCPPGGTPDPPHHPGPPLLPGPQGGRWRRGGWSSVAASSSGLGPALRSHRIYVFPGTFLAHAGASWLLAAKAAGQVGNASLGRNIESATETLQGNGFKGRGTLALAGHGDDDGDGDGDDGDGDGRSWLERACSNPCVHHLGECPWTSPGFDPSAASRSARHYGRQRPGRPGLDQGGAREKANAVRPPSRAKPRG